MPCRRRPVQDLFDFCARIDLKRINKRTLEALIRSGALDRLGCSFFEEAKAYQANIDRNRAVLLAAVQAAERRRAAPKAIIWTCSAACSPSRSRRLCQSPQRPRAVAQERLKGEKDTLGLYLTGHPIDEYEGEIRRFARQRIIDLRPARGEQTIARLIVNLQ